LPAFYKKNAIDLVMFGYVKGMTDALPAVKICKAVERYLCEFGLEEDYPADSAMRTYTRICEDFLWLDEIKKKNSNNNLRSSTQKDPGRGLQVIVK